MLISHKDHSDHEGVHEGGHEASWDKDSKFKMQKEHEYGTKVRLLRVMRAILDWPYGYTRRQLAERYGVSRDTIDRDFEALQHAGFVLRADNKHRYAFVEDQPYKELKSLLHFSEEDQLLLEQAIDQIADHTQRGQKLKRKLGSLYDYGRLGYAYLRKPHLTKVDLLLKAQKEKRQVILEHYRSSNSDAIRNRLVEAFHISPADDMLHAYDLDRRDLRHFRLSRFQRVQLTDQPWQYENHHHLISTDPFRIVDAQQVMVHLRLKVGAYNELVERFPLTKRYIEPAEQEGVFDFQCKVNHRFLGITNFILGHYHQWIEVLAPDELLDHLRKTVEDMHF